MSRRLDELSKMLHFARCQEQRLRMENQSLRSQLTVVADTFRRDTILSSPQFTNVSPIAHGLDNISPNSFTQNIAAEWHVQQIAGNHGAVRGELSAQSPDVHQTFLSPDSGKVPITKVISEDEGSRPQAEKVSPFSPLYGFRHKKETAVKPSLRNGNGAASNLKAVLTEAAWHLQCVRVLLLEGVDAV